MLDKWRSIVFSLLLIRNISCKDYQAQWVGHSFATEGVVDVVEKFRTHQLVPQLIPNIPDRTCEIIFRPGLFIQPGQTYHEYQTDHQPEVLWAADPEKYYTLYTVGVSNVEFIYPDRTIKCEFLDFPRSQWIQWLVTNIPGVDISKGTVLHPFTKFNDPVEDVRQAYVFIVYEQKDKKNFTVEGTDTKRFAWGHEFHNYTPVSLFMKKNPDLQLIEANFFYLVLPDATTRFFHGDMMDQTPPVFVYRNIST